LLQTFLPDRSHRFIRTIGLEREEQYPSHPHSDSIGVRGALLMPDVAGVAAYSAERRPEDFMLASD
jgi:hypothetical protein